MNFCMIIFAKQFVSSANFCFLYHSYVLLLKDNYFYNYRWEELVNMELDKVFSLIDKAERSSFNKIEIQMEDVKLSLERAHDMHTTPVAQLIQKSEDGSVLYRHDDEDIVFAPISGVYYMAKEPGASPFVREGKKVVKGETLCIIEAMKMMNEICAPKSGVIESVFKEDGQAISAKDPLFKFAKGK